MKRIALTVFIGLSGCASIMSDNIYNVKIDSERPQSSFTITNSTGTEIKKGVTPDYAILRTSRGYFSKERYTITTTKEGYTAETTYLEPEVSAWYVLGNLLIGGLVGWVIVDPITGSMYNLPDSFTARNGLQLEQKLVPPNRIYGRQDKTEPSRLYVAMSDDEQYKDCTISFTIGWDKVADFKRGEAAYFYLGVGNFTLSDEKIGTCPKSKKVTAKIGLEKNQTINILLR